MNGDAVVPSDRAPETEAADRLDNVCAERRRREGEIIVAGLTLSKLLGSMLDSDLKRWMIL